MARRNVFFYEMRPTRVADSRWRMNAPALIKTLRGLSPRRLVVETNGYSGESYDFVQVVENGHYPAIAYVRCRGEGWPMLARATSLAPFTAAAGQHLAELIHIVFFDDNIIGAEYHHYGPRVPALAGYLAEIVPQLLPRNRRIRIASLARDARDDLKRVKSVRNIKVVLSPTLANEAMSEPVYGATVYNPVGGYQRNIFSEMDRISNIGAERRGFSLHKIRERDTDAVMAFLDWALEQGGDLLHSARVDAVMKDGSSKSFNLLQTKVGVSKEMDLISPNARSVSHASAIGQIAEAYTQLQEDIYDTLAAYGE